VARYHLYKGTRGYDGHAYRGPSSQGEVAEADTLEEAEVWRSQLLERNPGVGWGIYDTQTGEDIPFNPEKSG
jgi:hypothetical protein